MREKLRMSPDCVWYHGPFAMQYAFLPGVNSNSIIVAHSHELCDIEPILGRIQRAFVRRADLVIVPEPNRAWILKISSGSKAPFFEIPNRPSYDAVSVGGDKADTAKIFREYGGLADCTRFLIYQGAFMPDRCLKELILGFKMMPFKDTGLILMGGDSDSESYKDLSILAKDDRRIVILPRIPPPDHLLVTKGCIGGVLLYAPTRLNNVYCAPNKIYEYSSLGLDMIMPDYPGLASINSEYGLGILCDPSVPSSIAQAIKELLSKNRVDCQESAKKFIANSIKPSEAYYQIYIALERLLQFKALSYHI